MKFYLLIVLLFCASVQCFLPSSPGILDQLAHRFGTDKKSGSNGHSYTAIYESYFSSMKDKPIDFLEIGFAVGGSARMWDNYFSRANCYFIDNNPQCIDYLYGLSNRVALYIGDQGNQNSLLEIMQKINVTFDIIIDDGGHTMQQQLISFETLFPYVKPGGIYIVEDMHTSYWHIFGNGNEKGGVGDPQVGPCSMTEVLKKLIDEMNYIAAYTGYASRGQQLSSIPRDLINKLNYCQKHIASIHFYPSLCFIFKKNA